MTSKTMPLSGGDYILDGQGLRRVETLTASRLTEIRRHVLGADVDQGAVTDDPAALAAMPGSDAAPAPVSTPRPASRARTQRRTSST
jgi:hypothetical protein